jgi:hypothetical protein
MKNSQSFVNQVVRWQYISIYFHERTIAFSIPLPSEHIPKNIVRPFRRRSSEKLWSTYDETGEIPQ